MNYADPLLYIAKPSSQANSEIPIPSSCRYLFAIEKQVPLDFEGFDLEDSEEVGEGVAIIRKRSTKIGPEKRMTSWMKQNRE